MDPAISFDALFTRQETSLGLSIVPGSFPTGSRVGGNPPEHFQQPGRRQRLLEYRYLATIGPEFSAFTEGRELSIFLGNDFRVFSEHTHYPQIDVECVLHEPSARSSRTEGRMADIAEGSLERDDTPTPFITIGGAPLLLQDEPAFIEPLAAEGLIFIIQIDDDGYPPDFVTGEYPLGSGALYLYAEWTGIDSISRVVAGFTQFS